MRNCGDLLQLGNSKEQVKWLPDLFAPAGLGIHYRPEVAARRDYRNNILLSSVFAQILAKSSNL
jgi:hypothetical protein